MDLSQYIELTHKAQGHAIFIRAGDISAIVNDPEGVVVLLNNGLAYQVAEAVGAIAKKMKGADE